MTRTGYTYYRLNPDGTTTGLADEAMREWQPVDERRIAQVTKSENIRRAWAARKAA